MDEHALLDKYGADFERMVQAEMEKMMAQVYQEATKPVEKESRQFAPPPDKYFAAEHSSDQSNKWRPGVPEQGREKQFRASQREALEQQKRDDLAYRNRMRQEDNEKQAELALRQQNSHRQQNNQRESYGMGNIKSNQLLDDINYRELRKEIEQQQRDYNYGDMNGMHAPPSNVYGGQSNIQKYSSPSHGGQVSMASPSPSKPARFQLVNDMYGANNIFSGDADRVGNQNWKPSQPEPQNMREKKFRENQKEVLARQIAEDKAIKEKMKNDEKVREQADQERLVRERRELELEGKDKYEHLKTKYDKKKEHPSSQASSQAYNDHGDYRQHGNQNAYDSNYGGDPYASNAGQSCAQKNSPGKPSRTQLVNDIYTSNNIFNDANHAGNGINWRPSQPEPQNMREKKFRDNQKELLARQIAEDKAIKEKMKNEEKVREQADQERLVRERRELELEGKDKYDHLKTKYDKKKEHPSSQASSLPYGDSITNTRSSYDMPSINVHDDGDTSFMHQKRSPEKASRLQLVNDVYTSSHIFGDEHPSAGGNSFKIQPKNDREKKFRDNQKEGLARQIAEDKALKEKMKNDEKVREQADQERLVRERRELELGGKGKYDFYNTKYEKRKESEPNESVSSSLAYGQQHNHQHETKFKRDVLSESHDSVRHQLPVESTSDKGRSRMRRILEDDEENHLDEARFISDKRSPDREKLQDLDHDSRVDRSLIGTSKFISAADDSGYYVRTPPSFIQPENEDDLSAYRRANAKHRTSFEYGDKSRAAMEYRKESEHGRNALKSPESFLRNFQNKYELDAVGTVGSVSTSVYNRPTETTFPNASSNTKFDSRNNHFDTGNNFDDHSIGIRSESKLIPDNIPAHAIFGETSVLERSLYSDSILDYGDGINPEFYSSVRKPTTPTYSKSPSKVSNSAEKSKSKSSHIEHDLISNLPGPTFPGSGSKPTTPGANRPPGKYQSPNIVLTSAVGKQILAEHPLATVTGLSRSGVLGSQAPEHSYEGVEMDDNELIVIPTMDEDAASSITLKSNIVKDYNKLRESADQQAKLNKDAIAAKLTNEIQDQEYRNYLKKKENEIIAKSLNAHVVNNVKPMSHEDPHQTNDSLMDDMNPNLDYEEDAYYDENM